eukprot:TRINITY_DN2286_c0_g1_i1.p1 TRINITY_DN2286_c0_g1~~TRINITY_DN2286_c0_g1_i1.p1  ORF type:complete len:757 (+),score=178.06 TRINITY_DN2286_c0_g1_i1:69-2273(+)
MTEEEEGRIKYTYTLEESLHLKQKAAGVSGHDDLATLKDVLAEHGIAKGKDSMAIGKLFEDRCMEANQPMYSRSGFGTSAPAALQVSETGFKVKNEADLDSNEKLMKVVHGILNKLTPEKYDTLSRRLTDPNIGITSNGEYMNITIKLIFDRAVVQPSFCEMYADLSRLISKAELRRQQETGQKASQFRRILVETVQREYNYHKKRGLKDGEEGAEEKKRKLGNIQFVGELYRKQMLTDKVMHLIITEILYGTKELAPSDSSFTPEAGDLEVLCRLLKTTGKELEGNAPKTPNYPQWIERYFERLEQLTAKGYDMRTRMLVLNLCDARQEGWPVKEVNAKKLKDLERENEEREKRKLEGTRHSNHTGDKTAWGIAAELHSCLVNGASNGKKEPKPKEKKRDEWQMARGDSKNSKGSTPSAPANGEKTSPTGGIFASLNNSPKKKKQPKQEAPMDTEKEKLELLQTLLGLDSSISLKIKARALECMETTVEGAERKAILEADFKDYKNISKNTQVTVVHEVLRAIAVGNNKQDRDALITYVQSLEENKMVGEKDVTEAVACFVAVSVNMRLVEEVPNCYKRTVDAMNSLKRDILTVFEQTIKYTQILFSSTPEEELLVESSSELFHDIFTSFWCPCHPAASEAFSQAQVTSSLDMLCAVCCFDKTWLWADDELYLLQALVSHLIEVNVMTEQQIGTYIENKGKKCCKDAVKILKSASAQEGKSPVLSDSSEGDDA